MLMNLRTLPLMMLFLLLQRFWATSLSAGAMN